MRDAERLQIGHHGSGGVEIEIRRQVAGGRSRSGSPGAFSYPMRQNTDQGGTLSPNSLPQIRVPAGPPGAWLMAWSDRLASEAKRRAIAHPPVGRQQAIVARMRLAEGGAREPRDDLAAGGSFNRSRTSVSRFRAGRRVALVPVEHRRIARRWVERVGHLVADIPHRPRHIQLRRPLRTASARSPPKSQKNGKGAFEPHSSPMNSMGMDRRQQQHCQRRLDRPRIRDAFEPVAQRAIADLVVVLQEVDEGDRRQMAARLAARCRGETPTASP